MMKKNSETGIALLLVLWILILLSVMAGEFSHTMRTEVNITRNFRDETQAYYLAEAGIYQAIFELIKAETEEKSKSKEKSRWRINAETESVPFGDGRFMVRIDNESGKVDLNAADEATLKLLLGRFAMDESRKNIIADSVQDWRDTDNLHRANGAENDYYQSLPEHYACKNADFDSVEELLLVRGVTEEIFYGGLKDMLTVHRGDSPKARHSVFGGGGDYFKQAQRRTININAASPDMLRVLPLITEDVLQRITEYRENKDFESEEEIRAVLGPDVQSALMPYITVEKSAFFTITSVGKTEDSEVMQAIQALVKIDPVLEKKYRIILWTDRYDVLPVSF